MVTSQKRFKFLVQMLERYGTPCPEILDLIDRIQELYDDISNSRKIDREFYIKSFSECLDKIISESK